MKKNFVSIIILLIVFFVGSKNNFGQDIPHHSWGISATVNASETDLLIPIWLGESNTLAPAVGIVGVSDINTDVTLGLVLHHYIKLTSNFSPIIGARGGALLGFPNGGINTTDILVGLLGGGEYFFSSNFSAGIEAQFNLAFSDKNSTRFGNPGGTNYNTGSVVFVSVYF